MASTGRDGPTSHVSAVFCFFKTRNGYKNQQILCWPNCHQLWRVSRIDSYHQAIACASARFSHSWSITREFVFFLKRESVPGNEKDETRWMKQQEEKLKTKNKRRGAYCQVWRPLQSFLIWRSWSQCLRVNFAHRAFAKLARCEFIGFFLCLPCRNFNLFFFASLMATAIC